MLPLEHSAILLTCIRAIIGLKNKFWVFLSGRLRQVLLYLDYSGPILINKACYIASDLDIDPGKSDTEFYGTILYIQVNLVISMSWEKEKLLKIMSKKNQLTWFYFHFKYVVKLFRYTCTYCISHYFCGWQLVFKILEH